MEHPLIHDISSLTVDELTNRISDLHKKLAFAHRTGNGQLCNQIRMAIDSYTSEQNKKLDEQFKKSSGDSDPFDNKINIS